MLQIGIKIIEICSGKKIFCPNLLQSHFSILTLDDHMHFHHGPQETLTDTRLVPLETRRASLPRYYKSEASKPPESALYL